MGHNVHSRVLSFFIAAGVALPPFFVANFLWYSPAVSVDTIVFPEYSLIEQIAIFTTAFILKPLYMVLALVIAFLLLRRLETELVALKRAMIVFFLGEGACAINYLLFDDTSILMESLHNSGMVICFGLVTYAVLQALDGRVFYYSSDEKRCALLPLCGGCYKLSSMRCNLRLLYLYVIPALFVAAALPLKASVETKVFVGHIFDKMVKIGHPASYQFMEVRFFPVVAMVLLAISYILLLVQKEKGFSSSKIYFSAGVGVMGFTIMRFICYWGYDGNPLWANVWEEVTEFLFIIVLLRVVLQIRAGSVRVGGSATP